MQQPITKEDLEEQFNLASMSSLFDLQPSIGGVSAFGNISGSPSHSHSRSISSESGSSLHQALPTSSHPSLEGYQRRRVSPNEFIPEDAPTQSRRYLTPSATSKKTVPSYVAARSAKRAPANSDEEDELADEPLPENATEQERIEYKRRQNTLAARRSRRRRMAQFQKLEDDVTRLTREKDVWKERALMMQRMLSSHGFPCPNFDR